jgi:hypothetical protein
LKENQSEIEASGFDIEDFEEWRDFEIYTNYIDSHLRFNNSEIEDIFQKWRKRY